MYSGARAVAEWPRDCSLFGNVAGLRYKQRNKEEVCLSFARTPSLADG